MNRKTCITEVWDNILKFNEEYFPAWRNTEEVYYTNALAGEVGEVCNAAKHRNNGGTKNKYVEDYELIEELADCFIYMTLIMERKYFDVETFATIIQNKINKNKERMEERRKQYNEQSNAFA